MRFELRWCLVVTLLGAVGVAGCTRDKTSPAAPTRAAAPPAAAPASAPASAPSTGKVLHPRPVVSPATQPAPRDEKQLKSVGALAAAIESRVLDVAAGKGDLAALWRGLPAHVDQLRKVLGTTKHRGPRQELDIFREQLEFLSSCRAVKANDPGLCTGAAPLGPRSVASCQGRAHVVRTFLPEMVQSGKCDAATLDRAGGPLRLTRPQVEALCTAFTGKDAAKCATLSGPELQLCQALASRDAARCGARDDCPGALKLVRALEAKDARLVPVDSDMGALVGVVLGAPATCAELFRARYAREVAPIYAIK